MRTLAVLEEVADAPFLAQAAEEVEVALVVLTLIIAKGVELALDTVQAHEALVDGEGIVGQQFVQDMHHALVLEDAAVGAQRGLVQPGAQGELVLQVAAFLAPEAGLGDEGVYLAHADAHMVNRGADRAREELAHAVQLDRAADLATHEAVEVPVGCTAGTGVQTLGGLEQELVFERRIEAFAAREANPLKGRAAQELGDGGAADFERVRARSTECGHGVFSFGDSVVWRCSIRAFEI
ncbi:hypothetical protein J2W36_004093 [Variovorax ginsengisoli]|uniref:Uncharacterized protein n=1 Tax=Variovorax ginsengisoli TaxID=363844 RepID=A0ABT9SBU7_9BURK|nr:hypothetical protein [Variovorax ginsengisoli]